MAGDAQSPKSSRRIAPLTLVAAAGGLLAVVCCGCLLVSFALSSTDTAPAPSATPFREPTVAAATPIPSPIPDAPLPTPEPDESEEPIGLPGLAPYDVTAYLEEMQFTCSAWGQSSVNYQMTCERDEAGFYSAVYVHSRTPDAVDLMDARVILFAGASDDTAATVLGHIAALPYSGSEPEAARAWVEEELPTLPDEQVPGDLRSETFGGVEYRLYGATTSITLEVGTLAGLFS